MSRYNPDHARLFAGASTPEQQRRAPLRRSFAVELVRHADDRARFLLDTDTVQELRPIVGDRLECETKWPDGGCTFAVDVYAVHSTGFVDVRGFAPLAGTNAPVIRLRRYPKGFTSR